MVTDILSYQYIKCHKVMYGKYLLILVQCLNLRFQDTTRALQQLGENVVKNFYKLMFEVGVYYDGYDRKLLIVSTYGDNLDLISIIYNKDFDGAYAHISMRTIIDVLFAQYNAVQLNIAQSYEDSSESEVDDQKEMELTLSQNTKEIFKLYLNPYDGQDEYSLFKDLVEKIKMHEASAKILEEVVNELPVGSKKFLTDYALRIKKVEGENNKIEKRKIFKVNREAYRTDKEEEK